VLFLLNVAGERKLVHGLARQLPLVPESLELPAVRARPPFHDAGKVLAKLGIVELTEALAEDAAVGRDPTHRVVFVRQRE
jgi:hypothetical protein